jgi:predicted  nucleic acid-binding Zn-ribbon protein
MPKTKMENLSYMSEVKKLTQEEINSIKGLQSEYNKVVFELGSIESQLVFIKKQTELLEAEKAKIVAEIDNVGKKEKTLIDNLQEKYGAGNINMETGEITPL